MSSRTKELVWVSSLSAISLLNYKLDVCLIDRYKNAIQSDDENDVYHLIFNLLEFKDKKTLKYAKKFLAYFVKSPLEHSIEHCIATLLDPHHSNILKLNTEIINYVTSAHLEDNIILKKYTHMTKNYLKALRMYSLEWTPKSCYAFNLANAIGILKVAGICNYLSQSNIIKKLKNIAIIISDNYTNYYDFAKDVMISQVLINESKLVSFPSEISNSISKNQMTHVIYAIWQHIPWQGNQQIEGCSICGNKMMIKNQRCQHCGTVDANFKNKNE